MYERRCALMIFDWKANAIKTLREGKYSDRDKWERKKEYFQQLSLCAYLSSLGWDRERIFEKWKSIPNREFADGAVREEEKEGRFMLLYRKVMEKRYSNSFTLDYGKEHIIYKGEIDAINSLNSTYAFRRYVFNLLCLEKFYMDAEGKFELTGDMRAYCFSHANEGKLYCKSIENMVKANIKAGKPLRTSCVRGKVYASLSFYEKPGNEALRFKDPLEAILRAEEFVQRPFGICPICGKKFEKNGYTKREICNECYKKHRQESKNACKRAKRKIKKEETSRKKAMESGNEGFLYMDKKQKEGSNG